MITINVLLLPKNHINKMQEIWHREGPRRKPSVVIDYNAVKTFGNMSDQLTSYSNALRSITIK